MNVNSINDILDYITCPYKVYLKDKPISNLPATVSSCLTEIYEDTFKFMLCRMLINNRVKLASMNKEFNKLWADKSKTIKSKVNMSPGFIYKVHKKVLDIWNLIPEGIEVIAYKYPCVKTYKGCVVEGELDAVLYNEKTKKIEGVHCINPNKTDSKSADYYVEGLGSYFLDCLKEDFGDVSKVSVTLYNMDLISKYRWSYKDMQKIISNVSYSIQEGIFYPRNTHQICVNCDYKDSCDRRSK